MGLDSEPAGGGLVRASDADRDQAIEALAAASAEGRLTLEEYAQRSEAALAARHLSDLASLTADLPAGRATGRAGGALAAAEQITAVLGNESRKGPWTVPSQLAIRSVLGDCHLEMQQATIPSHVVVEATVRFGSVTIFVPDGVEVRMTGRAILSAKSCDLRGERRPGAPVIEVRCDAFCGAVTVRRPTWLMERAARSR